ncbi:MAG: hypothetical protein LC769_07670 [Chloroflexi bacterium]|nr:hypothetical protein [Chloroflexota bacterium]
MMTIKGVADAPTLVAPQYQERPLSIYIHVPFCQKRCMYCDFATFTGQDEQMPAYVAAVETEMQRRAGHLGRPPAQTVFLGGGTPSLLPPDLLARLLDAVRARFTLDPAAEITIRASTTISCARSAASTPPPRPSTPSRRRARAVSKTSAAT